MVNIVLAFIIALLWGVSPVVFRIILHDVPNSFVMLISSIVYIIGTMIYIFVFDYKNIMLSLTTKNKLIPIIILTTFFGFFLPNLLYFYVLKYGENVNITIAITSLYPIITLVTSYLLLNDEYNHLSYQKLFGFLMIVCGVIVVLLK